MRRPGFITNSSAFNAGGYLQDYSAQGYYQFLISLLGIVSGASFAAFLLGIRSVWYPYTVVRARKVAFALVNWLAAVTIVCFILSLFLVVLPVSEVVAFGVLTALSVSFALLGHRSHWASGLPEELVLAMESDTPLYELQSIDLDTSQIVSITEADVHVAPPSPQAAAATAPSRFGLSRASVEDVALAAIPAFFGLMGLAQLREGRWSKGGSFLAIGMMLGALSSWYLILPTRIGEFFSKQSMPAVTSLSWVPSAVGSGAVDTWVVGGLLGAFFILWLFQLSDTMRYISRPTVTRPASSAFSKLKAALISDKEELDLIARSPGRLVSRPSAFSA